MAYNMSECEIHFIKCTEITIQDSICNVLIGPIAFVWTNPCSNLKSEGSFVLSA